MSLWIERAARKAQQRRLLGCARGLLEVALAGAGPCEYLIAQSPEGGLLLSSKSGWALDRFLAEHGGEAAWRVSRDHGRVEVEGRAGSAHCRLRHDLAHVSPDPPRAGSARLLPAASG